MKIGVVCGGHGNFPVSAALYNFLPGFKRIYITNLYDNGKSTGLIRNLLNIYGPSDVRKIIATELCVRGRIKDAEAIEYRAQYSFDKLEEYAKEVFGISISELPKFDKENDSVSKAKDLISPLEKEKDISYFNAMFGILSYLTDEKTATDYILGWLDLNDIEIYFDLNEDGMQNVRWIYYETNSGKRLGEEEIVKWDEEKDWIKKVFYDPPFDEVIDIVVEHTNGTKKMLTLQRPKKRKRIKVDYLVIAPGTPFSSIIPTLANVDFDFKKCFIIPNSHPDRDSKWSKNIENVYFQLLGEKNVKFVVPKATEFGAWDIVDLGSKLALEIIKDLNLKDFIVCSDYDGTICSNSKNGRFKNDLIEAVKKKGGMFGIISGNRMREFDKELIDYYSANYGAEIYENGKFKYPDRSLKTDKEIIRKIAFHLGLNEYYSKAISFVTNNNKISKIVFKPVLNRRFLDFKALESLAEELGGCLQVAGKTTVEIVLFKNKFENSKEFLEKFKTRIYFGDELFEGNDRDAKLYFDIVLPEDKIPEFIKTIKE